MSKEARTVWKDVAGKLTRIRVLTEVDIRALTRYCDLTVMYDRAKARLEKLGDIIPVRNADGEVIDYKDRPEVARVMKLDERLSRLETKYGLTPSDRVGLKSSPVTMHENERSNKYKGGL